MQGAVRRHDVRVRSARSLGNSRGESLATVNLAEIAHANGDTPRAIALSREALTTASFARDPIITHVRMNLAGYLLVLDGDVERAARLEGYSGHCSGAVGYGREHTETVTHERLMTLLRNHFGAAELTALLAAGVALTPDEAIFEGLG
jgi:hypothetical protein